VRLRLRNEATNWPIVHPTGDIWVWKTTVEWYSQGKTPELSTRALWQSYQQSYLVAIQEELTKEIINFSLQSISYNMGLTALLSLWRKACCGFLSPFKIHCLWPDLNPQTLGQMASMLTTRPPMTTSISA
jgi:hypothetical protein